MRRAQPSQPWAGSRLSEARGLVQATAKAFHFFLELELAPLQLADAQIVCGGSARLFLDGPLENLVPRAEFANSRFNRHVWASILFALSKLITVGESRQITIVCDRAAPNGGEYVREWRRTRRWRR